MSITTILTDPAKGGTFLTWTVHFLAGHTEYYHASTQKWDHVVSDPLTGINSHRFEPNQPHCYQDLSEYLERLLACEPKDFHTIYFHNFAEFPYSAAFAETKKAVDQILVHTNKIIVLTNQESNLLYEKSYRSRMFAQKSWFDPAVLKVGDKEQFDNFIQYFFADSYQTWQQLDLTDTWDLREFLALNYTPDTVSIAPLIDLKVEHYSLDCIEWFTTADSFILDLCNYLEIIPDPSRLAHWSEIYQSWRANHYQRLNFLWSHDKIINYIVTGKYMDLQRFDLDIYQEAIIQHALIYHHNLNLKTFKLEKFKNTQQLHHLLEPNIHNLLDRKNTLN